MRPVVTAAEMRALDRATIDDIGLPGAVLMETAGRAVADQAEALAATGPIVVVCGPGNNGGDGLVAARVLRDRGRAVSVFLLGRRERFGADARLHLEALERAGGLALAASQADELGPLRRALAEAAVIIDALFGTGLDRALDPHAAALIALVNAGPGRRLAVDLPSGLHADLGVGVGAGPVVAADVTITLGALKLGLVGAPGFVHAGRVVVADIGIPRSLMLASALGAGLYGEADAAGAVPRAHPLDHKGRRGHVAVVGGGPGQRGAGRLAARAAARIGAGLVSWLHPGPGPAAGEVDAPDHLMRQPVGDGAALAPLLTGRIVVVGPGLGTGAEADGLLRVALASGSPLVIDADALTLLAPDPARAAGAAGPAVLTPHPKEAARLLGTSVDAVAADRIGAARTLATRCRAVIVLKGARTVVCDGTLGDPFVAIIDAGDPALATGGSGDVLAGAIAGLIAQGLSPGEAARAAAWVHGRAGERLAAAWGPRGAVASDLPDELAHTLAALVAPAPTGPA